jgi:TonB-linked SusC/RagA family outer membrane protein
MKITAFLLTVISLHAVAGGHSQTITISARNAPLEKIFTEIKKQTGYEFVYRWELLQNTRPVDLDVKNASVKQVLDICLKDQRLDYKIMENLIVLSEKAEPKNIGPPPLPLIDITGVITDADGRPLPGANVKVKGVSKGTTTNQRGEFTLTGVDENATLEISFVGYEAQTIAVKNRSTIHASLALINKQLDEMIVQAYGTTTRRLNTGNISKVSGEDISKQPVSNPLAALAGRVPGMIATQTSGVPGSAFKVEIRGRSALDFAYSRNDPLFIIDGVPFDPGNLPTNQVSNSATKPFDITQGGLSALNTINPADIESIEVLKDADATAIYGSRGANGVILITMKKGQAGKTTVTASVTTGTSKVGRTMDVLSTQQYLQMRREAFANDGITPTIANAPDILLWDTTNYTDFKKLFIGKTAKTTNIQLSASGGNSTTQFLIGLGYNTQTNVFSDDLTDKVISSHFNVGHKSNNERFAISLSGSYSSDKNQLLRDDLTTSAMNLPPHILLYDSLGNLKWNHGGVNYTTVLGDQVGNPLSLLKKKYTSINTSLLSNLILTYKISKDLTAKLNLGYTTFGTDETGINPKSSYPPEFSTLASSSFADSKARSWNIEPQIEYIKSLSKGKLSVLIGGTWLDQTRQWKSISATNYTNDLLLYSIGAAGSVSVNNNFEQYRYAAFFCRINYNWKDKFIVNLTGRRDGSSKFGPNRRFANFGAIGGGWIFSNESFIKKSLPFLSYGKIRGSFGVTGNDQIGNYKYLDLWNNTTTPYQGVPGLFPNILFNPDYNWERTRKFEMGMELGFLKDRILFSASYYQSRSGNQLVNYKLPNQTGFPGIIKNLPALVENKGVELVLTTKNFNSKNFTWTSSINITLPKNKLISFPGLASSSYAFTFAEGKSLSTYFRYRYLGVNDTTGLYTVEDVNKDGLINNSDLQFLGNLDPKFYGGFQNNLSYKNIEFSFFFEFKKQVGENYLGRLSTGYPGRIRNQPVVVLDRWQKPGDKAQVQKYASSLSTFTALAGSYLNLSDGIYSDASYIRLKNISLAYNLPSGFSKKLHLEGGSIFFQGQNVFVITKYVGSDPETQDLYTLPPLKTFVAGIKLTF